MTDDFWLQRYHAALAEGNRAWMAARKADLQTEEFVVSRLEGKPYHEAIRRAMRVKA